MPELPEVETTRRGLEPHVTGRRIESLNVRERRLRWRVAPTLPGLVTGQTVEAAGRRAKYLLLRLTHGTLLWHLGMSGSLRVVPSGLPPATHDHIDLVLDSGQAVRFNDPRRFGSLHYVSGDPEAHPLLCRLAPEPFDEAFDADYLWRVTRGRRAAIKLLLLNSRLVTGVGNIYASEVLFQAGVRPKRQARNISRAEAQRLVVAVRQVLGDAIRAGGTTLRDYINPEGRPGYFRQRLFVYERGGEACRRCSTPVRHFTQGQRSTYYCPTCQH